MFYPDWLPSPQQWDSELRFNKAHDKLGKFAPKSGGSVGIAVDTKHVEDKLVSGEHVTVAPAHVDAVMKEIADAPSFNLNKLQISGPENKNCFHEHARDIPRIEMPQIPPTHGQVFQDALGAHGLTGELKEVDPRTLRATQNELDGPKVAGIYSRAKAGTLKKGGVVYASRDGDILDGHHRWAAVSAANAAGGDHKLKVVFVNTDIDTLLSIANTVSAKKLGSGEDR